MSDPFLAEIRMFACKFAPVGWARCDGQLLPLSQNTALFSLIGTYYGGDGKSNFALPNLQGRVPVDVGQGTGLSIYDLGQEGGSDTVTLSDSTMPKHNHSLMASGNPATASSPSAAAYGSGNWNDGKGNQGQVLLYTGETPETQLNATAIGITGSGAAHNNMMPYLTLTFCIATRGIFPARG